MRFPKMLTALETLSNQIDQSELNGTFEPLRPVTRVSSRVEFPKPEFQGTEAISSYIDGESIRIGC
jgi:hypothetical protein